MLILISCLKIQTEDICTK